MIMGEVSSFEFQVSSFKFRVSSFEFQVSTRRRSATRQAAGPNGVAALGPWRGSGAAAIVIPSGGCHSERSEESTR
jgi:hypothetical protein